MNSISLIPGGIALPQLRAVWDGSARIALDDTAWAGVRRSAEAVRDIVAAGKPAYGINTGFGKLASTHIAEDRLEQLQTNLIRSHAVGVGGLMDDGVVRLILAMKIASQPRPRVFGHTHRWCWRR